MTGAKSSIDSTKWVEVTKTKMKLLQQNKVWKLMELPLGWKIIGSK